MNRITAIILTYNEEIHLHRCISSIKKITQKIYIIDSFSTDSTINIAKELKCEILFNKFKSHADQINWALSNIDKKTDWILRIDADEIINESRITVKEYLDKLDTKINGLNIRRNIYFGNELVKSGGVYNQRILRIIRSGFGKCENKAMDEHLISEELIIDSPFIFSDISLRDFKEFICKHIDYANLEVISRFEKNMNHNKKFKYAKNTVMKKFLKKNIFYRLPSRLRPFLFYFYRLFIRGGIFDTKGAFYYHLFQGLMYRSFVEYLHHKKTTQKNK